MGELTTATMLTVMMDADLMSVAMSPIIGRPANRIGRMQVVAWGAVGAAVMGMFVAGFTPGIGAAFP